MSNNMMHRAIAHMEREPNRVYTLTELRRAAGITVRSQYRLSQQLLDSGMVERASQPVDGGYAIHGYRFNAYLIAAADERALAAAIARPLTADDERLINDLLA